jgi:AraC-like DNA-binding protein
MVPDGCMDLIVQLDRASGQILGFLVGTVDHPVFVPAEDTRWDRLGIRLYPGGLQRFLKEPGYLFTNRICRLADINKTLEAELADCMLSASSVEQLISAVHRCLLARVHGGSCWEDTFRNILHHLFLAKGNLTVHELSRRECVSGKQLGRIFLERTGLSTKAFAQIIRFQHVLRHLNLEANPALIQAALQHGYYDQAHFIHEFAGFSGLLPSDYVKRSE